MNADVYEEIWESFVTGDCISQGSIWGGEGLALIIPIEVPDVLKKIEAIQSRLVEHLPFSPHSAEIIHITIYLFGNPPEAQVTNLSAYLRLALAAVPVFETKLARVNSFFRAPFLEVHDAGALERLMASIQPGLKALGYPGADYGQRGQVFHVTLGAYTQSDDGATARGLLKELHHQNAGILPVNELRLVKTSSGFPYRMETLERFLLS